MRWVANRGDHGSFRFMLGIGGTGACGLAQDGYLTSAYGVTDAGSDGDGTGATHYGDTLPWGDGESNGDGDGGDGFGDSMHYGNERGMR